MSHLMEAFVKYMVVRPDLPEGIILLHSYFISQAAPDIQTKFQSSALGPQTLIVNCWIWHSVSLLTEDTAT